MAALNVREDYYLEEEVYAENASVAVPAQRPAWEPVRSKETAKRPHINTNLRSQALILTLALITAVSIITARSIMSAVRGTELVQTIREAEQLENENLQLELEISRLKSPQHIKDFAINHLGMVVPKDVYFAAEKQ